MLYDDYCFEGTAKVVCKSCKQNKTVLFSGNHPLTISQGIKTAMIMDGWDAHTLKCPDCMELEKEGIIRRPKHEQDIEMYDSWDDDFGGED